MNDDNDILMRRVHNNLLYDFYFPLLTDKQRKVYETLCFSDLTPTEAAELLGMTRQAVYILVHSIMDKLESLEEELSFAATTQKLEARIRELEGENKSLRQEIQKRRRKERNHV